MSVSMEDKAPSCYISVIKRWRRPILPPLITAERREEISEWRRLARIAEERLNRRREERDYLKAKIRVLVEKFQVLNHSSAQLVQDRPSASHITLPLYENVCHGALPHISSPNPVDDLLSISNENCNSSKAGVAHVRTKYYETNEEKETNLSEATNYPLFSLMPGLFIASRSPISTSTPTENFTTITTLGSNALSSENETESDTRSVNSMPNGTRKQAFIKELDTTSRTRTFTPVSSSLASPSDVHISVMSNEFTDLSLGTKLTRSISPQPIMKDGGIPIEEKSNIEALISVLDAQKENRMLWSQVDKIFDFKDNSSSVEKPDLREILVDINHNVQESSGIPVLFQSNCSEGFAHLSNVDTTFKHNESQFNESNLTTACLWVNGSNGSLNYDEQNDVTKIDASTGFDFEPQHQNFQESETSLIGEINQLPPEHLCHGNEDENGPALDNEDLSAHNSYPNSGSECSPNSRVMIEDSEASFHTVTPSTDLEKYMNSSAETLTSPSTVKTSEKSSSLNGSLVTELSSRSEDVTVINLSSGSTTPVTYEDPLGSDANKGSVMKDVLNVVSDEDFDNYNNVCGKSRIRHNSFTLEVPSPVLLRALANNILVGPATPVSTYFDKTPTRMSHIPKRTSPAKLGLPVSLQSKLSSEPLKCAPNSDVRSKNLASGILKYSEQQIKMLEAKHKELRGYLDQMKEKSSPLKPTPVLEFLHPITTGQHSEENVAIPISSIREVMQAQEQYLEQLKQQLLEQHQQQMAELFEQQQLQWQTLTDFLQHQDGTFSEYIVKPFSLGNENTIQVSSFRPKILRFNSVPEIRFDRVVTVPPQALDPLMKSKFDRVSAAAKGFLTRRLMQSDRVQSIIQTIKDTVECALQLHTEDISEQDAILHQRLIIQLNAACHEFHDVFFSLDVTEKMALIAQTRNASMEKKFKVHSTQSSPGSQVSSATLKVLARKYSIQSRVQEHRHGQRRRISSPKCWSPITNHRAQSCPPNRNNHQSPSSWKSTCSSQSRTISRKVKKIPTKPFRP